MNLFFPQQMLRFAQHDSAILLGNKALKPQPISGTANDVFNRSVLPKIQLSFRTDEGGEESAE